MATFNRTHTQTQTHMNIQSTFVKLNWNVTEHWHIYGIITEFISLKWIGLLYVHQFLCCFFHENNYYEYSVIFFFVQFPSSLFLFRLNSMVKWKMCYPFAVLFEERKKKGNCPTFTHMFAVCTLKRILLHYVLLTKEN